MNEIKCPHCGKVFQVDESGYAAILKQVRDEEFTKELNERELAIKIEKESALKLANAESKSKIQKLESELESSKKRIETQIRKCHFRKK